MSQDIFKFALSEGAGPAFLGYELELHDSLTRPYLAKISALSPEDEMLAEADLLGRACVLTISAGDRESRSIYGYVSRVEVCGHIPKRGYLYKFQMSPRLAWLGGSFHNRIFGTGASLTLREFLTHVLSGHNILPEEVEALKHLGFQDYDMRLSSHESALWSLSHQVQYDESDLSLLQRTCEHYGVSFAFDCQNGKDQIVFADSNSALCAGTKPLYVAYRDPSAMFVNQEMAVTAFKGICAPLPNRVILHEYREETPDIDLTCSAQVSAEGIGVVNLYSNGYSTPEQGQALAHIRAEELRSISRYYAGQSNAIGMRAGGALHLSEHFLGDGPYLVTEVVHRLSYELPGLSMSDPTGYVNDFKCVKMEHDFRSERLTPKPRLPALYSAHVDGSGDGNRPEIDGEGKYRIQSDFDRQKQQPEGLQSVAVRKSEVNAGPNGGMHFPLLKHTEVIVGSLNGDPSRPVILGALSNTRDKSSVLGEEYATHRLLTASKARFQIDDGHEGQGVNNRVLISTSDQPDQAHYFRLGKERSEYESPFIDEKKRMEVTDGALLRSRADVDITSDDGVRINAGKSLVLNAGEDHISHTDDYLLLRGQRMNINIGQIEEAETCKAEKNNIDINVENDMTVKGGGDLTLHFKGHKKETFEGDAESVFYGASNGLVLGIENSLTLGANTFTVLGSATYPVGMSELSVGLLGRFILNILPGLSVYGSELKLIDTEMKITSSNLKVVYFKVDLDSLVLNESASKVENSTLSLSERTASIALNGASATMTNIEINV